MEIYTKRNDVRGFTLVEVTLVIGILLGMTAVVALSIDSISDWKLGRSAGEDLRSVYLAQKSYLADHPTADISTVAKADLEKYLPQGMSEIGSVEDLDGNQQTIIFTEMPPVLGSATSPYDGTDKGDDGIWDVGKR